MVYIKGKNTLFYTFSYKNFMVYMIGKRVFILQKILYAILFYLTISACVRLY